MVAECLIWTSNEYIYCASQAGWLSLFSHLFILGYGCCVGTDFPPQWHSPYHKQRHLQMFCISSRYFSIPFPPVVSIPTVPESWSLPLLHISCGICHVSTLLANVRMVSPDGIASSAHGFFHTSYFSHSSTICTVHGDEWVCFLKTALF